MSLTSSYPVSIAPMMGYTDRHFRYLMRLIHPRLVLYTEMLTTGQVLHGDRERLLGYANEEKPLVVQLAGCEPKQLGEASLICRDHGYEEINLNIGCPSKRISAARYGACLFKEPGLVADCVAAMIKVTGVHITVKTRIAVDDFDQYQHLHDFISKVASSGCDTFIIHARKAWLEGLNPKQNRQVPKLQPELVYQLKKDLPDLNIIINGGIRSADDAQTHLQHVDGVMLGRIAYQDMQQIISILNAVDNNHATAYSKQVVQSMYLEYLKQQQTQYPLRLLAKPLSGLHHGVPGAQIKRRLIQQIMCCDGSDTKRLDDLCAELSEDYSPAAAIC